MENSLVNKDGSVNKEELEKITNQSHIYDYFDITAKEKFLKILVEKRKRENKQNY